MTGVANLYDTTGKAPYDLESTAMILQALAPYYTDTSAGTINSSVKSEVTTKVDGCVASIKQLQTETGGIPYAFFTYGSDWSAQFDQYADSCDAMAQIILAFTALGIDIDTVIHSNGTSMLDNFLSSEYQTSVSGEFRANSTLGASYSTYYTTKFAYLGSWFPIMDYRKTAEILIASSTAQLLWLTRLMTIPSSIRRATTTKTTPRLPSLKTNRFQTQKIRSKPVMLSRQRELLSWQSLPGLALLLVKKARTSD